MTKGRAVDGGAFGMLNRSSISQCQASKILKQRKELDPATFEVAHSLYLREIEERFEMDT